MREIDIFVPWNEEEDGNRRHPGFPPMDEPKGGGGATFEFYDMLTTVYWDFVYYKTNWQSHSPVWQGAWQLGEDYDGNYLYRSPDVVTHGGSIYLALVDHNATATTEPGVGETWSTWWTLLSEDSSSWKGEWQAKTAYAVGNLIWRKDDFDSEWAAEFGDYYAFAVCRIAHTSKETNKPSTVWMDVENMIYTDGEGDEYSQVGTLDITLDDCGWAFWSPYEIDFYYHQGECKQNLDTLADEIDTSNDYRWTRKPLVLVGDRDEDSKIWDMSDDKINIRLKLKTSDDNIRGDVSPDLIEDEDTIGPLKLVTEGDGTDPVKFKANAVGSKCGLQISEEGVRTLASYFTKNDDEVDYGDDWLEPFSLKYYMFDTTDSEYVKVTRSLDYDDDEVSGKFINNSERVNYQVFLMPRLTAYYARSTEYYEDLENRDVDVAFECTGVEPPYYEDGCNPIAANCTNPDFLCFENFWGGVYNRPQFAYSDAYDSDYEATLYWSVTGTVSPTYGVECCIQHSVDAEYGWTPGVGETLISYICDFQCGIFDNCNYESCIGCDAGSIGTCDEEDEEMHVCNIYRHYTFRRQMYRRYLKQYLGIWWDRLPNRFRLLAPSADKVTPTFSLNDAGSADYEMVGSVFDDESLTDAIAHAQDAGIPEAQINYICGFNNLHVFAGIGDDTHTLNIVTEVDRLASNYGGDPLWFQSVPTGKALDTTYNWGAREIFEYDQGMYDALDEDYEETWHNWLLLWDKMKESSWVKNYYNDYEDDAGGIPAPGNLLLQGNYDTIDVDMPWGIGFTPAPEGTLLAIIRKNKSDTCWYVWQRKKEDVTLRQAGVQFVAPDTEGDVNYDRKLSFFERNYKVEMTDDETGTANYRTVHWDQFSGVGRKLTHWGRVDVDDRVADYADIWDWTEDAQCPHEMNHPDSDEGVYASHCALDYKEIEGTISIGQDIYVLASWVMEFTTIND